MYTDNNKKENVQLFSQISNVLRRIIMSNINVELLPKLPKEVVEGIEGFKLDAYLIALEGWRRGLKLTWYKESVDHLKLAMKSGNMTLGKHFSLSSDTTTHHFFCSRGDKVSNEAYRICQDKKETQRIISDKGVPVTGGELFKIVDKSIYDYAEKIGFPVVIKPANGTMGRGVYTNIKDLEALGNAIEDFKKRYSYKEILVEKHFFGDEYRIYVVGDKVIGATNRVPANIQGDGIHTISELIELKNEERLENPYLKSKPIKVDYEIELTLKELGLTTDSIPGEGETISMRKVSNLSAGGDPLDYTDELTDEVKQIAVDGVNALPSTPQAGIDVIVNPDDNKKGNILEVNGTAEIAFHMFPWNGKARDVSGAIVDYYFPETADAEKSTWYFDYPSVLEPLRTSAAGEVTIAPAPVNSRLHAKRFVVKGKVLRVGYMSYIRRQALKRNLHGYVRKIERNSIEVIVSGEDKAVLENFNKICNRGSKKSKVESVEETEFSVENKTLKLGFQILLSNKNK